MILAAAVDACVSCSPANSSLNADLALFFAFFSLMGGLAGLAAAASASAGAGSAGASAPSGPGSVPNAAPSAGVPHGANPPPGAGTSSATRNPDGSLDLTFPDGRSMHLPHSHSTQYFSNEYAYGNYTAHEYPGGETREYSDGTIMTRFSDGTWIGSSPDGTWWTKARDDAAPIFHVRDGSVINTAFGHSPAGKPGGLSGSVNDGEGRTSSGTVPAGQEPDGSTGSVPWDDPL